MSAELDHAILIAFARAASQAQEIEAILQEMLIAAEVANDTKTRSFEGIAAKIEKLPLGPLKKTSEVRRDVQSGLCPGTWFPISRSS